MAQEPKSPLIAKAITQVMDAWFKEEGEDRSGYYSSEVYGTKSVRIDSWVDLDELGKHIAASLGH